MEREDLMALPFPGTSLYRYAWSPFMICLYACERSAGSDAGAISAEDQAMQTDKHQCPQEGDNQ